MNTQITSIGTVCIKNMACFQTGMRYDLNEYFSKNGYYLTETLEEANYIIVISCAVVSAREIRTANFINNYLKIKKKRDAKIILMGCLPSINKQRFEVDDEVIQIEQVEELDKFFKQRISIREIGNYNVFARAYTDFHLAIYNVLYINFFNWGEFPSGNWLKDLPQHFAIAALKLLSKLKTHRNFKSYFIFPNFGCAGKCSFCAVRCAIGRVRSLTFSCLESQFQQGLDLGFKYFKIMSSDLKNYGIDNGESLQKMLDCFTQKKGDYIIELGYINASWIVENIDSFIEILKRDKITSMITSLQSGSQRILDLMNRNYDIEQVEKCLLKIKKACPQVKLNSAIIVGFPTETEEDFNRTRLLLERLKFSELYIYEYNERPNTPAADFAEKVAPEIIRQRVKQLNKCFRKQRQIERIKSFIFDYSFNFGKIKKTKKTKFR